MKSPLPPDPADITSQVHALTEEGRQVAADSIAEMQQVASRARTLPPTNGDDPADDVQLDVQACLRELIAHSARQTQELDSIGISLNGIHQNIHVLVNESSRQAKAIEALKEALAQVFTRMP